MGAGGYSMGDQKGSRARPPLKLRKERLRLLCADDLAQVAGGNALGRKCSRFCPDEGY